MVVQFHSVAAIQRLFYTRKGVRVLRPLSVQCDAVCGIPSSSLGIDRVCIRAFGSLIDTPCSERA